VKRTVSILLLTIAALGIWGQEPSYDQLTKVAKGCINRNFPKGKYEIAGVRDIISDSVKTMFVIDLLPEGWILLAADKGAEPVIGFSFEGRYTSVDNNPGNPLSAWMDQYHKQIKAIKSIKSSFEQPGWKELSGPALSGKGATEDIWVGSLIKVLWDQGNHWNQFCPEDPAGPGGHVYVGCVAVAMSQAMSVYKKPVVGKGTNTYSAAGYGIQFADYGATTYKWDSMSIASADKYNALLLYHCAVAVNMNFGADASGSLAVDASSALKKYFSYSRRTSYVRRLANDQDWMNLLNGELLKGHPLIYAGDADDGAAGHCFNIDGVANSTYYHINWGWSGANNGYFTINSLRPGGNDFTKNNAVITGIQPYYYPTGIVLSDTVVKLNFPAGKAVGKVQVTDEATDNLYTIKLTADSTFNGTSWTPDYLLDGDTLRTNRLFTQADLNTDTVRFSLKDMFGNELNIKIALRVGAPATGINLPAYGGEYYSFLYPNPASDYLIINNKPGKEIGLIKILSSSGSLVALIENPSDGSRIDVSTFPSGLYIFEAELRDKSLIRGKIIIR
jgi:hypothetical protein